MARSARITVEWGYDTRELTVTPSVWQSILAGGSVGVRGDGHAYEEEEFSDLWMFGGGLDGELRVSYSKTNGDVWDEADGFVGRLKDATIEEFDDLLWGAYVSTVFEADVGPPVESIEIRIGSLCSDLDRHLDSVSADSWVFVTAWNPSDERPTREENCSRNEQLRNDIEGLQLGFFQGRGRGTDPSWDPEESFLVVGASFEQGIELGRNYRQRAIAAGRRGQPARLLDCSVDAADQE